MSNDNDFSKLVGEVTRLKPSGRKYNTYAPNDSATNKSARRAAATATTQQGAALSDEGFELLASEESLTHYRPGLDRSTLKRLRQGHFRPAATLDLHGLNVEHSRDQVWWAIQEALKHNDRCIRIVHGKAGTGYRDEKGDLQDMGTALIKSHVSHWLQQIETVMAFCSAQPKDGGTGAVYVLLKKQPKASD